MKHNEVLYHRLSDLGYYMPFDYKQSCIINN